MAGSVLLIGSLRCLSGNDIRTSKKQYRFDKQKNNFAHAHAQCAKKLVSDSPELVDVATGLVNSVLNLPNGPAKFFGKFKLQKN